MLRTAAWRWRFCFTDAWLAAFLLAAANILALICMEIRPDDAPLPEFSAGSVTAFASGGLLNLLGWLILRILLRRGLPFCQRVRRLFRRAAEALREERGRVRLYPLRLHGIACSLARFATHAREICTRYRQMKDELEQSRALLSRLLHEQQALLESTNRSMTEQYRHVLAYANYLDEHIVRHQRDAGLRYDFDDLCESGFNLKLIAQSLALLRAAPLPRQEVDLPNLLQEMMLALAPALDRRSMKLSTAGVSAVAAITANRQAVNHALWMMLLGIIRYAESESTLRLRCDRQAGGEILLSIVVSELSPGSLSPQERYEYLLRQTHHPDPHMFAETVGRHGNVQLAGMLLSLTGGRVELIPLTDYACEIAVFF